jgi:ligand-binding sensor domain-containing protein
MEPIFLEESPTKVRTIHACTKKKKMMKYAWIYTLFLLFVCCPFSKGQTKTHLPPDTIKPVTDEVTASRGPNSAVRTIMQDRKGNMWLASNEGIFRYDGKLFTHVTSKLTSARFFSLLEDIKGNFWFATYGSGVYYYDGKSFQHFTTKEGLANNQVFTMYEDKTGGIWFGANGAISRYDGKTFQNFTPAEGLSDKDVTSIMEDKNGKFWFGTRGYAYVYNGKTFTKVTNNEGEAFYNVWSIIEDKKGSIWLGGGDGLWRYNGTAFTLVTPGFVGYVYEDKKGNIWTSGASDQGQIFILSRYEEKFLSDKKPMVSQIAQSTHLFGILEDDKGDVWFGAFDGVYRYDGNTVTGFKGK